MDAITFVEELHRMCKTYVGCFKCPAKDSDNNRCRFSTTRGDEAAKQIELLEKWSAEHQPKTRQSIFLEQWPETERDSYGVLQICPMNVSASHRDSNGECKNPEKLCRDCRREFWLKEINKNEL